MTFPFWIPAGVYLERSRKARMTSQRIVTTNNLSCHSCVGRNPGNRRFSGANPSIQSFTPLRELLRVKDILCVGTLRSKRRGNLMNIRKQLADCHSKLYFDASTMLSTGLLSMTICFAMTLKLGRLLQQLDKRTT